MTDDLKGRRVVVTGANSGLGLEIATLLASRGAAVVLACRDQTKGAQALDLVGAASTSGDVELRALDLADLASVRAFAADAVADAGGLDVLVNNAGVMAMPRRTTADGFELQFGTNHLGHFALTGLLLPALLRRPSPRVVTVSSLMHIVGRMRFADLQGERRYNRWVAYCQSKLANLLFAFELDRRARGAGLGLVSAAAHPGYTTTNLQTASSKLEGSRLRERGWTVLNAVVGQPVAQGVLPIVHAATSPDVRGGTYWGPSKLFGLRAGAGPARATRAARDEAAARRLWDVSVDLTGVSFQALSSV